MERKMPRGVVKPYRAARFALGKKSWRNRDRMRPWESPGRQRREEEDDTADMWGRAAVREKWERGGTGLSQLGCCCDMGQERGEGVWATALQAWAEAERSRP